MKPIRYAIENNAAVTRDDGDYVRFDEYEQIDERETALDYMLTRALDEIDMFRARIKELEGK